SIWWEEHILYFTPYTFSNFIKNNGMDIYSFAIYPYSMEDSLVIIAEVNHDHFSKVLSSNDELKEEVDCAFRYAEMYPTKKQLCVDILTSYKKQDQKISILGAGHLGCHYINLMGIANLIDVVIDDDPNKQSLLMLGSQLP